MADPEEIADAVADVRRHVEWLRSIGQKFILADRAAPKPRVAPPPPVAPKEQAAPSLAPEKPPPPSAGPRRTLEEIRAELGDCKRCKLCSGRTNIVFGVGNPKAELVFVGEG